MIEERRREILAQVFREQNKQECDGSLFGANHKALVAMRRAEIEIIDQAMKVIADMKTRTDGPQRDDWQLGYAAACREISDILRQSKPD